MIVVTTPTGQIGSQVARGLLAANEKVRVIARDPKKLGAELAGKVEVVEGSSDDEAVLARALDGAESIFVVVPPSFTSSDVTAHYVKFAHATIRAMKQRGVKRAVGVSALGHQWKGDAGMVSAALAFDAEFGKAGVDYRALWAGSFMENMLRQLQPLREKGMFFLPADGKLKTRHSATRDIAAMGAKLLRDRSWTGHGGVGILGTEDQSFDDLAAIMTEVLGKPIRFQQIPVEAYKQTLLSHGASESVATALAVMMDAKAHGLDEAEPRTAENTTPTSFRAWCEEVLKPAFTGS